MFPIKSISNLFYIIFLYQNLTGTQSALSSEIQSKCLSEKASAMSIKCPANKITRILKAFYGYSWSGDCHFIEKDCIVDVPNDDLSCLGEGCSVKIIESPIILQECWNLMASYIQIDYECIPVEELQNMCTVQESEYSVGYIVTPNYPSMLPSDLSCPCTIQAPIGYALSVEVLDFRLPVCSQAGLTLWSDSSTYTHCLSISNGILPGSESQNISMRLHSQNKKINAGFLLKYYTNPPDENAKIKFVCYGSLPIWSSRNTTYLSEIAQSTQKSIPVLSEPNPNQQVSRENNVDLNLDLNLHNNSLNPTTNSNIPFTNGPFKNTKKNEKNSNITFQAKEEQSLAEDKEAILLKSYKVKPRDWTIIIISVIASVIFLLVLINALIWFIFSIKKDDDTISRCKSAKPNLVMGENYFPPTDYYKVNFQNDDQNDIYALNNMYNNRNARNFNPKQSNWNKTRPYSNGSHEIKTSKQDYLRRFGSTRDNFNFNSYIWDRNRNSKSEQKLFENYYRTMPNFSSAQKSKKNKKLEKQGNNIWLENPAMILYNSTKTNDKITKKEDIKPFQYDNDIYSNFIDQKPRPSKKTNGNYEEQEGNFEIHSEYSFFSKIPNFINNLKSNTNQNSDKKNEILNSSSTSNYQAASWLEG